MKNKKKKIALIVLAALAVCGLGVLIAFKFVLPVTYTIDKSLIQTNPDYNVYRTKKDGYTAIYKAGEDGEPCDAEFKVIGFTDTHLDRKKEKGDVTMEFLIRNIVNEKPDLVVLVGDNITSAFTRERIKQLAETMEELGVYWAPVLGNHEGDNFWCIQRQRMLRIFARYPHCLVDASYKKTSSGEKVWGHGNYVINILGEGSKIVRSLYFIDGGSVMTDEDLIRYDSEFEDKDHNDYDYVKDSQITWYKETVAKIGELNGAPVKSTVFDHIALPEYKIAYEKITGETEVTQNVPEYNVPDADGDYILAGQRREVICNSGHNSGFFDAILETGSTDSFICGHDHINDFVLSYKGIILAYNVPSGYSSYNLVSKGLSDKLMKGFSRYFIASDGTLSIEQVHNADLYPEDQDRVVGLYQ